MAYLHACVGCSRQGAPCPTREALNAQIRGLGISSLRHRCAARVPRYTAGQAVVIHTYDGEHDYNGEYTMQWWPVWFIEQKATRAICFIRPGTDVDGYEFSPQHSRGYVKVPLFRVKAASHEPVELARCEGCGDYTAFLGDACGEPQYTGPLCVKRQRTASVSAAGER